MVRRKAGAGEQEGKCRDCPGGQNAMEQAEIHRAENQAAAVAALMQS